MSTEVVRAALAEFVRSAPELRRQRILYHYTNSRGLEGILSSGVLRASNYRHLNDASEVQYGCEMVVNRLARDAKLPRSRAFEDAMLEVERKLRTRWNQYLDRQLMDIYVTSFCGVADRLSQWRAYGKPEGSYCIAFEISRFDGVGLFWPRRVIYEPEEQQSEIKAAIDRLEELSASLNADDVEFLLRLAMTELACRLKHPSFREEEEWRSIIDISDYDAQDVIRFPPSDSGSARPFVELIRGSVDSQLLPISQIIVGPSRDQPACVAMAHDLLERFGYQNAKLSGSRIPLLF
jgi:hypothetical protein